MAAYLTIRKGKVASTKEHVDGVLFADYDRKRRLLGIEILAPCKARVVERIATRAAEKRFVRESIPQGMLATA